MFGPIVAFKIPALGAGIVIETRDAPDRHPAYAGVARDLTNTDQLIGAGSDLSCPGAALAIKPNAAKVPQRTDFWRSDILPQTSINGADNGALKSTGPLNAAS